MTQGFGTAIDASVIHAAQAGQRAAQQHIYQTFYRTVLATLIGMCRDVEQARDLSQEVFIQVFQKLAQLRETSAFGGWLKQLTINTALAQFRKNQWVTLVDDHTLAQFEDTTAPLQALAEYPDSVQLLRHLEPLDRQLVWLFVVEDYSHEQVAKWFQVSPAAVRQRYHRALKKLQQQLSTPE